jgi:tetratricopeptide (TPR) repeat protein
VAIKLRTRWVLAAFCLIALALYQGSLRFPLVFDDDQLAAGSFVHFDAGSILAFDRRWISTASFAWMRGAFGPDWFWQRCLNVLLHAAAAAALFGFLRRLFGAVAGGDGRRHDGEALAGALLFLVHPVAVYGVAYLVQRSIVLATLFGIVSLWLFLEGLLRGGRLWHLASALAYAGALYSKEHAVMLPAVAALLVPMLRGWTLKGARELALPFGLYALLAVAITLKSRGVLGTPYEYYAGVVVRQISEASAAAGGADLRLLSVENQALLFFRYLGTWLLPLPGWMSIDLRTHFPVRLLSWPDTAGFVAWLAWPAAALFLLGRSGARAGPARLAGFAMLAPWLLAITEFSTVRLQEPFVLYRSYLWMCFLPAALPALAPRLRWPWRAGFAVLACLALLPPFFDRLQTFAGDVAVWGDAARKIPAQRPPYADRAFRNLGIALYKQERYDEALREFEEALRIDPGNTLNWQARGALYMRTAQSEKALVDVNRSLELDPNYKAGWGRRCLVLMRLGRQEEALADCVKAAEVDPTAPNSFIGLGMVRALRGEVAAAEAAYKRAIELDPNYAMSSYQYGVLLRGTGRAAEAGQLLARACVLGQREGCREARALGAMP